MRHKTLKYFSTVIVCAIAVCAGWWLWNYYMQSPWTRDGKVRAELVNITPEVSGRLEKISANDNQFVPAGSLIFTLDPVPYQIALDNAEAAVAKAQSDLAKADHEAARRRGLPRNVISAEDLDASNLAAQAMKAAYKAARPTGTGQMEFEQNQNLRANRRLYHQSAGAGRELRQRRYAAGGVGGCAFVLCTRLFRRNQAEAYKEGNKADIVLYNGNTPLQGK